MSSSPKVLLPMTCKLPKVNPVAPLLRSTSTSDLEIFAQSDAEISGKKLSDSTVSVEAEKGESTTVSIETTFFKNGTIANEGSGSLK